MSRTGGHGDGAPADFGGTADPLSRYDGIVHISATRLVAADLY